MASNNQTEIIAEPGKQELFIKREFEAPRELVFRAFTEADMLVKWLGPCNMTMRIDKHESWAGGSYRYVHIDPQGNEYGFHGVSHEMLVPERLTRTFEFEGLLKSGHVVLETARFEALPNERTKVTIQSVFQSVADRDGMVQAGMEYGVRESHQMLDEFLAKQLVN
jgi:uncharacterized protein YndB with AHSA1/START domain